MADPKPTKDADTVTVRLKHGRMLLDRVKVGEYSNGEPIREERYLEAGQTVQMSRAAAEKLAGRALEGYPGTSPNTTGDMPRSFADSPIEIVDDRRAA